ncbi:MAG: Calx-beta domain-containing protein [Planctomycetota bacterium]
MSSFPSRKTKVKAFRPIIETLEPRLALDATAWSSFGGNAQHTSISTVASQALEAVHWSTKVDNFPTSRAAHYGGPLITLNNTVIYPYKTGNTQSVNTPDYRIVARNGVDGALVWDIPTPYIPASYSWYPLNQPVLATATNRVYFAGKGGTIYYRDNPDSPTGTLTQLAFFGSMAHYQANQAAYDSNVFIDTPLTADSAGNIYFGFRVTGTTPTGLASGIARISANGTISQAAGIWVSAFQAAGGADTEIGAVQMNAAPAISNDGTTLYIVVKKTGNWVYRGRLVGLDTTTLATKYNSGILKDPRGADATILNDSTSSPMVAPDGRVFLGIFGNPYNGSRGWMLQFSADLQTKYTPGGFGWDTTPSIVPASMLGSQYTGTSPYLIFTKYNDYYFANGANDGGSGQNLIAVLDPNATEVEHHHPEQNILVMKRVLTKLGPTADWDYPSVPTAVREWCINYGAVDPATNSIIVNSSDGKFYRWHLPTNSLIEPLALTSGIGQPYTPTVIGVDGSTYGIQNGSLFALGQTPRMSINSATIAEGTGGKTTATFVVSLNYPRREAISVHWATQGGSALQGTDYTAGSGTLTFNPGIMSQTITVEINPDALNESQETFFVNLDTPVNAVLTVNQATGTISDDDAIPKLAISDVAISEGNSGSMPYTLFSFAVALNAPSGRTVSVQAATQDLSASSDVGASRDYVAWNGDLTFAPGETSKLITIQVIGDTTFESNETFQVKLLASTNSTIEDDTGIGSIINDDGVPSISIDSASFAEGTTQSFTVSLSNASSQPITVVYATSDGVAGSNDYVSESGTLTFAPGVLSQTVPIRTLDDDLNELAETFSVNLSQPVNAFIAEGTGVGTIIDDDALPSVSIVGFTANEGQAGTTLFQFDVVLSAVSGRDVLVSYTTSDGTAKVAENDYQAAIGTIHFLPGQRTKSIQVAVNGDNLNETDETFGVQLVSSDGSTLGTAVATGTIINDDALILSINDASIVEGDSGVSLMRFTVTMSSQSSLPVTVDFGTADGTGKQSDGDYETTADRLTFMPGETQKTIDVRIVGDLRNEAEETIFVRLSNSVGGTIGDGEGRGTIQDDDPMPSISVGDISFPEMDYNTGTVNLYVQLSAPSGQTITVDYRTENGTATSTSNIKDYIDTFGTITFLPGETVQRVSVAIVGDLRVEPDETVRLLLSDPVNATISDDLAILNILNDDRAMVTITGASVIEGDAGTKTVQVDVSLSNPSDSRITIDFGSYDGSAVAGLDYVSQTGTLVFEPGEMVKKIDYQVIGDTIDEPGEDFEVYLSNGTGPVFLPDYSETDIDIIDDDPPTAVADHFDVQQNDPANFDLLHTDSNAGGPFNLASLEFSNGPLHGSLALKSDGTVDWLPDPSFFGRDSFRYRVADSEGLFTGWTLVTIDVNARPVSRDDEAYASRTNPTTVNVLNNDHDPDDTIDHATIELLSTIDASMGQLEIVSNQSIRFTPGTAFDSWIRIQYRVIDANHAASAPASVLMGVYNQNPVNPLDVDRDTFVSPLDVLLTINSLNAEGAHRIAPGNNQAPFYDVNADGSLDPLDTLTIINYLNSSRSRGGIGEGEGGTITRDAVREPLPRANGVSFVSTQRGNIPSQGNRITMNERSLSQSSIATYNPIYRRTVPSGRILIERKLRLADLDAIFAEMDSE